MKKKYTIKKYDGDDQYSWAIFKTQNVKGKGNIIFYGEAKPIVCGLPRSEASHIMRGLELKEK